MGKEPNPSVTKIGYLISRAFESIDGKMIVTGNGKLLNMTGLVSLAYLGSDLSISNNTAMTSLDGLDSLAILEGSIVLFNNTALVDVRGLDQVRYDLVNKLIIENSMALSDCATKSICKYLDGNRLAHISNNEVGCNSVKEVIAACTKIVEGEAYGDKIVLYPDPTSVNIFVKGNTAGIEEVTIFSLYGVPLKSWGHPKKHIEFKQLPDDMYILSIQQASAVITKRVVKGNSKITIVD